MQGTLPMQEFPTDIKLTLMKFCDAQRLVSLGLVSKSFYKHYQRIQRYIQGWSHPDHFVQWNLLQQLMDDIGQCKDSLRSYYPILIEQLCRYANFDKHPVRNIYAYMLIAIMAAKINDSDNLSFAIVKLRIECIENARSDSLFQYSLCRINETLGISDELNLSTQRIVEEVRAIRGPYSDQDDIQKHAWLFKLALIEKSLLLNIQDDIKKHPWLSKLKLMGRNQHLNKQYLLEQICLWFQRQESATIANSNVRRDMYLNLRWLTQETPQASVQKWVSQQLLPSLLPLSKYNYRKDVICLDCDEALDIFQLVGVDYFSQLLKNRELTLWSKHSFLNLLAKCHQYDAIKKLVTVHWDFFFNSKKNPWDLIKCQLSVSKQVIAILNSQTKAICNPDIYALLDYLEKNQDAVRFQQMLDLLKMNTQALLTEKIQERIYQLALMWISNFSMRSFEPWQLKSVLPPEKYHTVEQQYTETALKRVDDYYSFQIVLHAIQPSCRKLALDAIEKYLSSQSMSLYDLNKLVRDFENLLTPKMRESILLQYHRCLPKEIERDAYHDDCRNAYKILKRWSALQPYEQRIKTLLLKYFNEIDFQDKEAYQFSINCSYAVNYLRVYLSLFREDNDNLQQAFFSKLKLIIASFCDKERYNCHDLTKVEMQSLLLRVGLEVAKEIVHDIWLPLLQNGDISQIEMITAFIQSCHNSIPRDLLTTELVPVLLLQKEHHAVTHTLLKVYDTLTSQQRQSLCDNPSPCRSIFIELFKIHNIGMRNTLQKEFIQNAHRFK